MSTELKCAGDASDAVFVRRLGVMGCELQLHANEPRISIPAYESTTVDTAGWGYPHCDYVHASARAARLKQREWRMRRLRITILTSQLLPVPSWEQIEKL